MSSAHRAGPDASITVKVIYGGSTFRAKMPLREMAPLVLEQNVRNLLHLTTDSRIMIERYSDSAAAYVMLDAANLSVYKQLYRAAKAKSKLKLRVSMLPPAAASSPKDVPNEADAISTKAAKPLNLKEAIASGTVSRDRIVSKFLNAGSKMYDSKEWREAAQLVQERRQVFADRMRQLTETEDRIANLTQDMANHNPFHIDVVDPVVGVAAAAKASMNSQERSAASLQLACPPPIGLGVGSSRPFIDAAFSVSCNSCERLIPATHYHCSTCDDGDFDLCQSCVAQGITCYDDNHWVTKRVISNGQIFNSSHELLSCGYKVKLTARSDTSAAPGPHVSVAIDKLAAMNPDLSLPLGVRPVKLTAPPDTSAAPEPHVSVATDKLALPLGVRPETAELAPPDSASTAGRQPVFGTMRTCNQCVRELPEREFVHCTTCLDYDLCQVCFSKDNHGHHPGHGFTTAVAGTEMPAHIRAKMASGRNQIHHAICDGCDRYIIGIRHKCLDCPDWDYCATCVQEAASVHPTHRFTAIYEPLADLHASRTASTVHVGVCCDGPLCVKSNPSKAICGTRYKCAICDNVDFCASCEASPANTHNKTHPLIKLKTPVRHVSITTTGAHEGGKRMPSMGDRLSKKSRKREMTSTAPANTINTVQTVVDPEPAEVAAIVVPPPRPAKEPIAQSESESAAEPVVISSTAPQLKVQQKYGNLCAVFLRDALGDGTDLPTNLQFEQTWTLRNDGRTTWPAGCHVKFMSGDYMGFVDSAYPAGIRELHHAAQSNICFHPVGPGETRTFTVLLRTPSRTGKVISYWRLTTPDGLRFGHRLWCEVNVVTPAAFGVSSQVSPQIEDESQEYESAEQAQVSPQIEDESQEYESAEQATSLMIFPKLENESPNSSVHESKMEADVTAVTESEPCDDDEYDDWEVTGDECLLDDDYDVLSSDEESFEESPMTFSKE